MEAFRSWLVRHRDQSSVSYSRFGRPGEIQDDKPPPNHIYVAPFNEDSPQFLFFNQWHVKKAATTSACFGMSMVSMFFLLMLIEIDWDHHKRGLDITAILFLLLFLAVGLLVHYYVLRGVTKQMPHYLLPFIVVYSCVLTTETFWCLLLFFKSIEPDALTTTSSEFNELHHPPFVILLFLLSISMIVQCIMFASVLRCRQFLSQKLDHELELNIATKSRTQYPNIQIIVGATSINSNPNNNVNGAVSPTEHQNILALSNGQRENARSNDADNHVV